MADAAQVVTEYWAAAQARDWAAFGALVSEDVVYEAPQSRERVRGRKAYVAFNEEGFPGAWRLAVERIVSGDDDAVSMIQFTDDSGTQRGLCFFDLDDQGRISRITDFWPEPYDPPANRVHLADRY